MCTYICKYKYRCSLSPAYLHNFIGASYSYQHHCICTTQSYVLFLSSNTIIYEQISVHHKHHKHRTCVEMINCHPHVPSCLHSTRVRLLLTFYILIILHPNHFFSMKTIYTQPGCTCACLYMEQHLKETIVGYNSSAVGYQH